MHLTANEAYEVEVEYFKIKNKENNNGDYSYLFTKWKNLYDWLAGSCFSFLFLYLLFSPWELLLFDLRCFLCGDDNNSCILEHVPGFSASFGQLLLDNVTYIFNLQNKL